jgi:glutamate-1-semialdehyde 2,1-aminomutase
MKNPNNIYLPSNYEITDYDRTIFERHLREFVPPRAFDAHAHLALLSGLKIPGMEIPADEDEVGVACYMKHTAAWMGDRCPAAGLFFAIPDGKDLMDVAGQNRFIAAEMKKAPVSRALMLIKPGDDAAIVERDVIEHRFAGFKVYHVFAKRPDTFNAKCSEYMPEPRPGYHAAHGQGAGAGRRDKPAIHSGPLHALSGGEIDSGAWGARLLRPAYG